MLTKKLQIINLASQFPWYYSKGPRGRVEIFKATYSFTQSKTLSELPCSPGQSKSISQMQYREEGTCTLLFGVGEGGRNCKVTGRRACREMWKQGQQCILPPGASCMATETPVASGAAVAFLNLYSSVIITLTQPQIRIFSVSPRSHFQ